METGETETGQRETGENGAPEKSTTDSEVDLCKTCCHHISMTIADICI